MSEFIISDGLSRLVMEREPDGRLRIAVHDKENPGYTVSICREDAAEVATFIYPVELHPTRPEDHRRDQYDPADDQEGRR